MDTNLWQTRSKFEPRNAGGVAFYVRRDPDSQKEVAFAIAGDYLLLATREDLLASALQLMSGGNDHTIETEQWWSQSVSTAGSTGGEVKSGPVSAAVTAVPRRGIPPSAWAPQYYVRSALGKRDGEPARNLWADFMKAP